MIRVPVCARVSRVCPVCVPAPPGVFLPVLFPELFSGDCMFGDSPLQNKFASFRRDPSTKSPRAANASDAPILWAPLRPKSRMASSGEDYFGEQLVNYIEVHFTAPCHKILPLGYPGHGLCQTLPAMMIFPFIILPVVLLAWWEQKAKAKAAAVANKGEKKAK